MVLRFVWPDRPPVKYLQNVWYVATWDTEVPADRPFGRMLLGEPVAFFRDTAGAVHALADQCPHRFAPLSKGRVKGDGLECGYHGLQFGAGGACIHNPQGDGKIPRAATRQLIKGRVLYREGCFRKPWAGD